MHSREHPEGGEGILEGRVQIFRVKEVVEGGIIQQLDSLSMHSLSFSAAIVSVVSQVWR